MMRVGIGWDSHRLEQGRKLVLGGVEVPFERGLFGHSDADVLLHAIIDAMLGAAALPDIGSQFPDSDARFSAADSLHLLRTTCGLLHEAGYRLHNLDSIIIAEQPKLAAFVPQMRQNIAEATGLPIEAVSVKCKTAERMDSIGQGLAMSAQAVVLIESCS